MRNSSFDVLCAYCGQPGADEWDHVIARQFFPPDQTYRGNLPKVPSCGTCNRRKQRVEDGPAVLFQFGDGGDASGHVLTKRVPRTLAKNARLYASLRQGLQDVLVRLPSGLVIPMLGIYLSPRERSDSYEWFQFVTRGLYCFEFKVPLGADHNVHLFWRKDKYFTIFTDMIRRNPNHQTHSYAGGEFQYAFASNPIEEMSLWLYSIKSINVLALTLSAMCPAGTKSFIARIEWPPEEPLPRSSPQSC